MARPNLGQNARICVELLESRINKIQTQLASPGSQSSFIVLGLEGVVYSLKDCTGGLQSWITIPGTSQEARNGYTNDLQNGEAGQASEWINLISQRARSIDDELLQRFLDNQEK